MATRKTEVTGELPIRKIGRVSVCEHVVTPLQLEQLVADYEGAVIVIRKPLRTKLRGYYYGLSATGRKRKIAPATSLDALQARLADYGLGVLDYVVIAPGVDQHAPSV